MFWFSIKPWKSYKMGINFIEKSGFKEGDELEAEAKKGEIKLRRK